MNYPQKITSNRRLIWRLATTAGLLLLYFRTQGQVTVALKAGESLTIPAGECYFFTGQFNVIQSLSIQVGQNSINTDEFPSAGSAQEMLAGPATLSAKNDCIITYNRVAGVGFQSVYLSPATPLTLSIAAGQVCSFTSLIVTPDNAPGEAAVVDSVVKDSVSLKKTGLYLLLPNQIAGPAQLVLRAPRLHSTLAIGGAILTYQMSTTSTSGLLARKAVIVESSSNLVQWQPTFSTNASSGVNLFYRIRTAD